MFEDSLLESSGSLSRRPWATAISFAAQIMAGGILLLVSLIYTQELPQHQLMSILESPAPPPASAPPSPERVASGVKRGALMPDVLTPPAEIPKTIAATRNEAPSAGRAIGIAGDRPGGVPNGVFDGVAEIVRNPQPSLPKMAIQKLRVSSGVAQGLLIHQIKPEYPPLARQARIQGVVVLQALIGKDGAVHELQVVSGHPLLIPAAVAAVKQWRYKPYYLNGEPVEVDTYIVVNFTLSGD